jgi:hypothetical protein
MKHAIEKATLSLFWYSPCEARPEDTIHEIYSLEKRVMNTYPGMQRIRTPRQNPGRRMIKMEPQGNKPYTTKIIKGRTPSR